MDNTLKEIKTYAELIAFAKVNGYGPRGTKKLVEKWENRWDEEPEPEPLPLDIELDQEDGN